MIVQVFRFFNGPNSVSKVYKNLEEFITPECEIETAICPFSNKGVINKLRNLIWISKLKGKYFHLTGDNSYLALGLILYRKNFIVTVLDFGMPGSKLGVKKLIYDFFSFEIPFRFAKKIVCISEFTQSELGRYYTRYLSKTEVIYVSLSNKLVERIGGESHQIEGKGIQVIQIATSHHNKNVERSILALSKTNYHFNFVGELTVDHVNLLNKYGIQFTQYINLNEEELHSLYKKSSILLFPSLYEGFGMPIIEAQSLGVNVITSDLPPMNEVAGGGALLVDPYNIDEISDALRILGSDVDLRDYYRLAGFTNVKRFLPNEIAEKYISLYKWLEEKF